MKHLTRWAFRSITYVAAVFFCASVFALPAVSQQVDSSLFSGLRWRSIGPFRGGRVLAVTGVPGRPNLFYFGAVGGGVWKTNDAGRTWTPIFDSQPIASIGAIAVAPSNPDVIYVGSGEADMRSDITYGNGVYKSTDGGKTWTAIGLRDSRQIGRIIVDPRNPDVVFVAALGHAYGPNSERGVFRSVDGGKTWQRVLFHDENTGAIDLAFDPQNSQTILAALWQTRRPPWNVYPPSNGPGSGLYRSTDGGAHWEHLDGHGLPSEGLGRMGIAFAPSNPHRIYLIMDAKEGGLYRSDDAGATWRRTDSEARIWGRGWYFCNVAVDPKDPDTVYVSNTSVYRSRDAGQTFTAIKGAPGGDDYHLLWIDPEEPQRMILGSDQGAVVTVNGGQTWSSWYNQPTGQFYHVITDNQFPYWVHGAQQDSGAAATPSRSSYSSLSFHDWRPAEAGGENGYIQPDPFDPDILYGGTVTRFRLSTGENQNIAPTLAHPGEYRRTWTLPLVFSPRDSHELYFGSQVLFRTTNGGQTWDVLSPDLTREDPGVPPNLDSSSSGNGRNGKRLGVIYAIAPSPHRAGEIWIGTDDGLIQVTRDDGKTWANVTPPELTPWSKVTHLEASRHDPATVYAAVDRHRLEDLRAHLYRTRDSGKTWKPIADGIPKGSYVNCIREDPVRKGLLYACTETGVFVSFNEGDRWQPLQLNMPTVPVRDLVVHEADLVIATHGRSFWVLDDVAPLRQLDESSAQADAFLFEPAPAVRLRPGSDGGTPLPPEEPTAENPPAGAILDYYLKSAASGAVSLEIVDESGKLIRRYSSDDPPARVDPQSLDIPMYWIHPAEPLSARAGMHRFVWDLHTTGVPGLRRRRSGSGGPWVVPGNYSVKLTVNGRAYVSPLIVKMDPRVKTPPADLKKQFELASQIDGELSDVAKASREAERLRQQLKSLRAQATSGAFTTDFDELSRKVETLGGPAPASDLGSFPPSRPAADTSSLRYLLGTLGTLEGVVESADVAPTPDAVTAFQRVQPVLRETLARWGDVRDKDVPHVNERLRGAHLPQLNLEQTARPN
ncbi:MAG TPA: hypothetical protein VEU31_10550 [Candidatus Acidoferrales bacterium]|nr:hypothetical protein [Candidatus Acidoferrales bacterium]